MAASMLQDGLGVGVKIVGCAGLHGGCGIDIARRAGHRREAEWLRSRLLCRPPWRVAAATLQDRQDVGEKLVSVEVVGCKARNGAKLSWGETTGCGQAWRRRRHR
jgi:hypothetical protein